MLLAVVGSLYEVGIIAASLFLSQTKTSSADDDSAKP